MARVRGDSAERARRCAVKAGEGGCDAEPDGDVAAAGAGREERGALALGERRELGERGRHDGRVGGVAERGERAPERRRSLHEAARVADGVGRLFGDAAQGGEDGAGALRARAARRRARRSSLVRALVPLQNAVSTSPAGISTA